MKCVCLFCVAQGWFPCGQNNNVLCCDFAFWNGVHKFQAILKYFQLFFSKFHGSLSRPLSYAWWYVLALLLFINYASACSSGHFGVLLPTSTRTINQWVSVPHEDVHVPVQVQARLLQPQRSEPRRLPSVFLLWTFAGLLVLQSPCHRKHHLWLHGRYNPTNGHLLSSHHMLCIIIMFRTRKICCFLRHSHNQNKSMKNWSKNERFISAWVKYY